MYKYYGHALHSTGPGPRLQYARDARTDDRHLCRARAAGRGRRLMATGAAREPVPAAAAWLGGLGLVPFAAGAAGAWLLDEPRLGAALFMLAAYAATILSFLGAVHWGLAMRAPPPPTRAMVASVLPALLAWGALSLPAGGALVILAAGFAAVYVLDLRAVAAGLAPRWYARLRSVLSAAVLGCLASAVAALVLRGAH